MLSVFIDGSEGTTGLEIEQRLSGRTDIEVLKIDPALRKDPKARKELLNRAGLCILCLPDIASREAVSFIENPEVRVIDASTAFRTAPGWVYGLPELARGAQRERIRTAKRVSVPGCHATGFNLLVAPLVAEGILDPGKPVYCQSITGYSGGGKKLIEAYEKDPSSVESRHSRVSASDGRIAPRPYALGLTHKHLPEMRFISGLAHDPVLMPILGDFYRGMAVCVPFYIPELKRPLSASGLRDFYADAYKGEAFVRVPPSGAESDFGDGCFPLLGANGTNRCDIFVFGREDQALALARLDNLGKGASGAAVQCMNLMLGLEEGRGLTPHSPNEST